ncbi:hypothetical protein [Thioalkalivibrio sp. ALE12]|uniref:hypothetical protein n=1 Tax=Thioalkalivibrio sp. ALE12 TaxID=1158170 RepID=UPI0003674118|nr:hypothetical protein [Thioalkalivibrio sp. ALE12]
MKMLPKITYRPGQQVTFTRNGDTLTIDGESYDLSGDWVKLEWDEGEDRGLLRSGEKIDGEPVITVTAYQPDTPYHKRAKSNGLLDAMQEPIALNDGESVTFPDYFVENFPEPSDA